MADNKRVTMKPRVSEAGAKKAADAKNVKKSKSTEVKKDADK